MNDIRARAIAKGIDHLATLVEANRLDMEEYLDMVEVLWTAADEAGVREQVDFYLMDLIIAADRAGTVTRTVDLTLN